MNNTKEEKTTILFHDGKYAVMETGSHYWNTLAGDLSLIGCITDTADDDTNHPSLVIDLNGMTFYFQPVSHCHRFIYYDLTGDNSLLEYSKIIATIYKFNNTKNGLLSALKKELKPTLKNMIDFVGRKQIIPCGDLLLLLTSFNDHITVIASETKDFYRDQIGYKIFELHGFTNIWSNSLKNPTLSNLALFVHKCMVKNMINKQLNITV